MNNLTFNEETHTYLVDGKQKQSVTDVLKGFGFMPNVRFCTDEDMWRGQQIHKAMEFYHKGILNEDTLDPLIKPYVDAWRLFEADTGFQAWGWEKPLYDPISRRCGRPDVWGHAYNEIWVLDYKSGGVSPATRLQLAGYQVLLMRLGFIPPTSLPIKRFAIQLKPTGKYNIKPFQDDDDLRVWEMLNMTFNWRESNVK